MKKITASFLVAIILLAMFAMPVSAESPVKMDDIEDVAIAYGVTIDTSYVPPKGVPMLEVESVEEFEALIQAVLAMQDDSLNPVARQGKGPVPIGPPTRRAQTVLSRFCMASIILPIFNFWENLLVTYTSSGGQITSVSNVTSYLTGLTIAFSWQQYSWSAYYMNGSNNSVCEISASGVLILGVVVGNSPIGASFPWTMQNFLAA